MLSYVMIADTFYIMLHTTLRAPCFVESQNSLPHGSRIISKSEAHNVNSTVPCCKHVVNML